LASAVGGLAQRAALLIALASLVTSAAFIVYDGHRASSRTESQIRQLHGIDWGERQVEAGFGLQVSRTFLLHARALVPPGSYRLVTGNRLDNLPPPVWTALPALVSYAVFPSRPSPDGEWLLCYACDISTAAPRATIVWQDGNYSIARVKQ